MLHVGGDEGAAAVTVLMKMDAKNCCAAMVQVESIVVAVKLVLLLNCCKTRVVAVTLVLVKLVLLLNYRCCSSCCIVALRSLL